MLKKYSINEIEEAINAARAGTITNHEEPLNALVTRITDNDSVYRITQADLETYLDDHDDLTEEQEEKFLVGARRYIKNAETFSESLQVCLEMAMAEAKQT